MSSRSTEYPAELSARSPVLIGRARELELLSRTLSSPPAVALIEGQAGVGKTRLLEELASDPGLHQSRVLVGHCHPLRDPFPLGPVIEALHDAVDQVSKVSSKPIFGALRRLLPDVGDRLPPEPEHLGDPAAARHQVFTALAEVLNHTRKPVLVLEDMHWSDEATCEFLSFLGSRFPGDMSLVVTFRPEEINENSPLRAVLAQIPRTVNRARLHLEPMDPVAVKSLIAAILGTEDVSLEFAAHIHERTGGLPFAVEEVLRLLHDRKDVSRKGGRWMRRKLAEMEVPSAINDAIIARLDHLGASARRITEAAAVVGHPADASILASVTGVPNHETVDALLAALAANLLRETDEGDYDFQHELARQAVYESVPLPLRQEMHLRAAEAIHVGSSPSPARLAHHYRCAGRREWLGYAEEAADFAISLGHDAGGARFLQEALTAPDLSLSDRVRMASKLGDAALHGLAHDEASGVLRDLLAEPLPPETQAELRLSLARLLREGGDASGVFRQIQEAVPHLTARPALLARAMGILANPWVRDATLDDHLEWLRKATQVSDRLGDTEVKAIAFVDRVTLLTSVGDPAVWHDLADFSTHADSAAEQRQVVRMCQNAAAGALWLGHYARARAFVDEGLSLSREIEYPRLIEALETTGMLVDLGVGRWAGLDSRARRLVDEADLAAPSKEGELILGSLLLLGGRTEEAETLLTDLVETCERVGLIPVLGAAGALVGRLALARGEPEDARATAQKMLEIVAEKGIWVWAGDILPVAIEALLLTGSVAEARDLTDRVEKGVSDRDAPLADAAVAHARGLIAEQDEHVGAAADAYALAEKTYLSLPRPVDAALALARRGSCLVAAGQDGAQMLVEALKTFDDVGANWEGDRLRRAMRAEGIPTAPRVKAGGKGYGDRLSPREEEVARLAASGLTNRAIAEELFLSPRTVAHHLERAMRKMGASSRTMLADRLRQDS